MTSGSEGDAFVVPLQAEQLDVTRRKRLTGRVVVSTVTTEREALVDELLTSEHAEIERVEIRQLVDAMPGIREEGDTIIVPVVEEVVVVERRLFLKEEVRIRRVQTTQRHQETVVLREQSLNLNRHKTTATEPDDATTGTAASSKRTSSMASETIVAVFDTEAHAEAAIADLTNSGVPSSAIQHYSKTASNTTGSDLGAASANRPQGGFWAWLTGEETSGSHDTLYDRSIESGGTVVTVITDDALGEKVVSILQAHAPIDLEERGAQYGLATGAATSGMGATGTAATGTAATAGYATGSATTAAPAGAEVLALSEESLSVGKRAVDRGTTRLRRYVVERPVEEQIRLRDETVSVFRRPVSGSAAVGADAFTDKVIEVRETAEEAVVAKSARVVEEVVVQKGVNERVETVRDTLRRDEVEITGPGATTTEQTAEAARTIGTGPATTKVSH